MSAAGVLMRRDRLPDNQLFIDMVLTLRTQHTDFLEYLSEREGINPSDALGTIIARSHSCPPVVRERPARKVRKHLRLHPKHLEIIDRMAAVSGLQRSDIVRRLIDAAEARDSSVTSRHT